MPLQTVLAKYRADALSNRDLGDRFERLVKGYLLTDPEYATEFKMVWLWSEFPGREDLGGSDTGIDLVAQDWNEGYIAIQCKFYQKGSPIDKAAVDSFLSTASRSFLDGKRFSQGLWISTTNQWTGTAQETFERQNILPVARVSLADLERASVDWEKIDQGVFGEPARKAQKSLYDYQKVAVDKVHEYFKNQARGKLIMACGTGKTLCALRIAEQEALGKNRQGLVLVLLPSIALLGQTLREWTSDAKQKIFPICVCSDPKISKTTKTASKNEDTAFGSPIDLALPASTSREAVVQRFAQARLNAEVALTVVFSTYQSIDVVGAAFAEIRKNFGMDAFDLVVCDEAHRTTGYAASKEEASQFNKVHDNDFLPAQKRLYMTATPRLYSSESKSKAAEKDVLLWSMDDAEIYGEEIHRIGFGEAVDKGILTDYKVLVLAINEKDMPPALQEKVAQDGELGVDDAAKLIGCINALSKTIIGDGGTTQAADPGFMKRSVAFCPRIADSKSITGIFNTSSETYISSLSEDKRNLMVAPQAKHIDGSMNALEREELLNWLKEESKENESRILCNVRCLSEGVDVPSLDAVMFLSARNSQVDVVQSVGRVMRRSEGKKYGYIIIPVFAPLSQKASEALDKNERYKVVWTVLNALRAHDDRFNATVNKIDLNKKREGKINVVGAAVAFEDAQPVWKTDESGQNSENQKNKKLAEQLSLDFSSLQGTIFARMVEKVGEKTYWETWASRVAVIAEDLTSRIETLVSRTGEHQKEFQVFLNDLQKNINPSIDQQQAIEMLAQHLITQPIFDALFEGYSFAKNNPVSQAMGKMLSLLEAASIQKDTETLNDFYESVRKEISGIDNAEGKLRILNKLYERFFQTAFATMVEKLGIVYTPPEVVDFVVRSVDAVLRQEFGRGLTDAGVNILDPFTGTGTFVVRLLQSGLIAQEDLERKYKHEIFANEIVLLAYYIAAVNIENAYHDLQGASEYTAFDGICLTDTFQLGERKSIFAEKFPVNSARAQRQQNTPITVILGNPPYSVGQNNANDNAQNQKYPRLEERIASTYAKETNAVNRNSLYDSYIKAFRWASDRLNDTGSGAVAFVSGAGWLDGKAMDGFRKCLSREFSDIWVFNLRGNCRTSGEQRRKEAGNIFGLGSRTPIAVTVCVRKGEKR